MIVRLTKVAQRNNTFTKTTPYIPQEVLLIVISSSQYFHVLLMTHGFRHFL